VKTFLTPQQTESKLTKTSGVKLNRADTSSVHYEVSD